MSTPSSDTTTVEIDTQLLDALRACFPGESDRSLLERLIRVEIGFGVLRASRNTADGLSEEEANGLAVRAVREVRAEMRAERR
jgi:hypothetical protein